MCVCMCVCMHMCVCMCIGEKGIHRVRISGVRLCVRVGGGRLVEKDKDGKVCARSFSSNW